MRLTGWKPVPLIRAVQLCDLPASRRQLGVVCTDMKPTVLYDLTRR